MPKNLREFVVLDRARLAKELKRLVRFRKDIVSAGEYGVHLGVARSTAKRYLSSLVDAGYAEVHECRHHNGQIKTMYSYRNRKEDDK